MSAACSMLSEGVVAIFGPISTKTNGLILFSQAVIAM